MTKTAAAPFLYCDIETLPSQDPQILADIETRFPLPVLDLDGIRPDGRLKDEAKIAEDLAKKRDAAVADHAAALEKRLANIDEAYRKTALDGSSGHLASIAWAFDEEVVVALDNENCRPIDYVSTPDGELEDAEDVTGQGLTMFDELFGHDCLDDTLDGERELLTKFFGEIEETLEVWAGAAAVDGSANHAIPEIPVIVAHHADFDIRFIWQRAIALGVPVPAWWPVNASKYASDRVQDTMVMWAGHGNRIGLDRLCRALGVAGKTDMDGSMVWDAVREGRIAEVVEYNRGDVRRLRSVHRRMRGLNPLLIDIDPAAERIASSGGNLDTYVVGQIVAGVGLVSMGEGEV
ncbi:MAG: hypothetical protein KJ944_08500 [Alphaproteobacteria bacterium]|nr:hypothetical protein [Alphaproteobacteria bacterium]MBU1561509.1 hypothetical protein [Alphaproteobacteria bacterium]MBU2302622.1 hypothetical protein [Alphaproteobacteria bacterium]MBU2368303.1 hypothetical protein [Alphaproteobacteria bacterium]